MYIAKGTILAVLGGIPFIWVFSGILDPVKAAAIYNILLLALIAADYLLTPGTRHFEFERQMEDRLSLGADNGVVISVRSLLPFRGRMILKDEYPGEFFVSNREITIGITERGIFTGRYSAKPGRRGMYRFGGVHVRIPGGFGLAGRQFRIDLSRDVKVYPSIRGISAYRILSGRNRILQGGAKPVRMMGMGTDFEYLRDYQPDDEFRKINWKATARRCRPVTSQFQADRSQNVFIIIDGGRMMMSRVHGITKLDYAMNGALMLAWAAMEKGDNVGLMVFADEIKVFLPPKRGRKQMNRIIEALYNLEPLMVEPDYGLAIRYLSLKNKKRSLVVLLTDLIDTDVSKAVITYMGSLHPVHLPLCVAISDPALEREAQATPSEPAEIYHRAVASDLLFQREQVKAILERSGVMAMDSDPEKLPVNLLNRYLAVKSKNRL